MSTYEEPGTNFYISPCGPGNDIHCGKKKGCLPDGLGNQALTLKLGLIPKATSL